MPKLHVFIDGTWLYKVFSGDVFDRFIYSRKFFNIDFNKLNKLILHHVQKQRPNCTEIGNCYFVTSIFDLPDDFDSWVGENIEDDYGRKVTVNPENIPTTKQYIRDREQFNNYALQAGYNKDRNCIFHVPFKKWMLLNLLHKELHYQEKQVDTTVVALLVRETIINPTDCFALVAGDSDILPAIKVVYPEFTSNIFPVLTSMDEQQGRNRQTSFKYSQYNFDIDTLILQQHIGEIMAGNVYQCTECHKFFTTLNPISTEKIRRGLILPRCPNCQHN